MLRKIQILIFCCLSIFIQLDAADVPITTDSRIRTYIYNENEVYKLLMHCGYQTSVEFGIGEKVSTISIGNTYAWKVTPVGRRLFIKPLQNNMHTNMTVLTNLHTYQFDLFSKLPDNTINKDLVYVVRFFYPEDIETEDLTK